MKNYKCLINDAPLIDKIDSAITTGDLDYDGSALEVSSMNGDDLFHVIVDEIGNRQFLFFRSEGNFRMPVELVEEIIQVAKERVSKTDL